jgi:hypothetical protein
VTVLDLACDADAIARAARIMAAAADLVDDAARLGAALDRYHQQGVADCRPATHPATHHAGRTTR